MAAKRRPQQASMRQPRHHRSGSAGRPSRCEGRVQPLRTDRTKHTGSSSRTGRWKKAGGGGSRPRCQPPPRRERRRRARQVWMGWESFGYRRASATYFFRSQRLSGIRRNTPTRAMSRPGPGIPGIESASPSTMRTIAAAHRAIRFAIWTMEESLPIILPGQSTALAVTRLPCRMVAHRNSHTAVCGKRRANKMTESR